MIGKGYWCVGISLRYGYVGHGYHGWYAEAKFYDSGFCNDDPPHGRISTEGALYSRYGVDAVPEHQAQDAGHEREHRAALKVLLDVIVKDAARLGIDWRVGEAADRKPGLFVSGDEEGEAGRNLPHGWQALLREQAERLGWDCPYKS